MKKQKKRQQVKVAAQRRRFSLIAISLAALLVTIAAITVVARQLGNGKDSDMPALKASAADSPKKYVTVKVAGRDVQVDPQTGQIKPLTPEEAQRLADGLKSMLNKSTDGLVQVPHADGSVAMDLQGRFQNVTLARVNADGTLEKSCVDEPQAAAQFLGIDPRLLGVETKGGVSQPVVRTPARKVSQ
jgi:hypothetical protein